MVFGLGKSCCQATNSSYPALTDLQRLAVLNYYLKFPLTFLDMPAFCSPSSVVVSVSIACHVSRWMGADDSVYIFVGCLIFTGSVLSYIAGSIVIFTGIGYVVLEFTPQVEPPSNMRDADAGWGAEQV